VIGKLAGKRTSGVTSLSCRIFLQVVKPKKDEQHNDDDDDDDVATIDTLKQQITEQ